MIRPPPSSTRTDTLSPDTTLFRAAQTQPAEPPTPAPQEPGPGILALLPPDSVTQHEITLDGERLNYTATAGTLTLRNRDGARSAALYYTAYTVAGAAPPTDPATRPLPTSGEHPSAPQSLMRHSYAVFCLKKKNTKT